ncbi:hypothetical protein B1207_15350 [Legionella quinlivanii]|uniref:Cyclic nucleotide-binding domain-containing protein n=1 Tax=Legionella quinlivanii TaxID=45073 RepID=A0A364LFA8_9GAMM|nr:cyclic nucleotide-binding domain-containing protein [Legionella quinlivanii]RAP34651.1 hypothetical protein B1207_15350 [Legionella quinlivanii]
MLSTYFKYRILECIPVKEASSEFEKDKIYKFRYEIYHNEYKMIEENFDHQRKILKDVIDDKKNSILTYTTSKNNLSSTCRAYYLNCNEISEEEKLKYYLHELPLPPNPLITFVERLAVTRSKRGKYLAAAHATHLATRLFRDLNSYFTFSSCSPGLLKHYMQLGYRPYTTELLQFDDRVEIPIVVMPDMAFLKKIKSILYHPMNKYCSNSLKSTYNNFRPEVLENFMTSTKTIDNLDSTFYTKYKKSFLYHLKKETINFIIKNCYFLNLRKGMMLFSEKEHHQEKFIILSGHLSISKLAKTIMQAHPGDIVGEFGTYHDNYLRYTSVTALEDCQLMVIPRGFEKKLFRFDSSLYINYMESYTKSLSLRERKLIINVLNQKQYA